MILSLSLTTNSGNYTKVVLQNNQNRSSSEVISFLKLSQVRNTETQKTEICIKNRSCFLFSRNNFGTLKTAIKKARAVRGKGKGMKKSTSKKVALINSRIITSRHTYVERITFLFSYLQSFPSTHTFLLQVEYWHLFDLWLSSRRGKKAFPGYLGESTAELNRKVNRARKTWISHSVVLFISLNLIICMGSAAPPESI